MWDKKSLVARERGTLVHERAERSILHYMGNGSNIAVDEILTDEQSDGISDDPAHTRALIQSMHGAVVKMSEVLEFIRTEQVIACPDLGLSGMVDLTVNLQSSSGRPLVGFMIGKPIRKSTVTTPGRMGCLRLIICRTATSSTIPYNLICMSISAVGKGILTQILCFKKF